MADILDGKGSPRVPQGHVLAGRLPARSTITITGGNLSLVLAMVGSKHAAAIDPRGKWLALEDLNEPADTLDRMLAGLKLAGLFERAAGIILGDFHQGDNDLSEAVYHTLRYHLPPRRPVPIIRLTNFGHIYPIAPLPLHRPVTLRLAGTNTHRPGMNLLYPPGFSVSPCLSGDLPEKCEKPRKTRFVLMCCRPQIKPEIRGPARVGRGSRQPRLTPRARGVVLGVLDVPADARPTHGNGSRPRFGRGVRPTGPTESDRGLGRAWPQFKLAL